jgi:hypothetical protein
MENSSLLISLIVLLIGVFVVRKLWLGALLAMVTFMVFKGLFSADFSFIYAPMVNGFVISTELAKKLVLPPLNFSNNHAANRQTF